MSEGAVDVSTPAEGGGGESIPVVADPGSGSVLGNAEASAEVTPVVSEPAATLPHWSDNFSNVDLKSDPLIRGFDNAESLANEHRNLQSLIGRKGVIRPADDAPEAHWEKFHNDMGRPPTPGEYKLENFTRPEGVGWDVDGLETPMLEVMHKAGLSEAQVNDVLNGYSGLSVASVDNHSENVAQAAEDTVTALKGEWGLSFDAKVDLATRAANKFIDGGTATLEGILLADGQTAADHPVIIKLLAKAGEISAESGLIGEGSNSVQTSTPAEAIDQYKAFEFENKDAILDPTHPMHKSVLAQRMRLREMING